MSHFLRRSLFLIHPQTHQEEMRGETHPGSTCLVKWAHHSTLRRHQRRLECLMTAALPSRTAPWWLFAGRDFAFAQKDVIDDWQTQLSHLSYIQATKNTSQYNISALKVLKTCRLVFFIYIYLFSFVLTFAKIFPKMFKSDSGAFTWSPESQSVREEVCERD